MRTALFAVLLLGVNSALSATVTGVSPNRGSTNGGTRITISGSGFAEDNFNSGEGSEDLGSRVYLESSLTQHECIVDKDSTDENTIVCETEPMKEGTYYVKIQVDGNDVQSASSYAFYAVWWRTPTISGIFPLTTTPESQITVHGRLFTDKVQASQIEANNGITASLRRVWVQGQACNLRSSADVLYGIELVQRSDGEYGNWGSFTCLQEGKLVKSQNITYIVDEDFGRSELAASVMKVSGDYKLYNYQTYATITGVSPAIGSNNGGAVLTVTGSYLKDISIDVKVAGESCALLTKTDDAITCTAPPPVAARDVYPGGRGARAEFYPGLEDLTTIESTIYEDYTSEDGKFLHNLERPLISYQGSISPIVVRMKGFFVPAKDGTYQFSTTSTNTQIYISTDNTRGNKVLYSADVTLTQGNMYYYEVVHQSSTGNIDLSFNAYLKETDYRSTQTSMSKDEVQKIMTNSPDTPETQQITLNNYEVNDSQMKESLSLCITCTAECSGEELYSISLFGIQSGEILSNAPAVFIQNAINQFPTMAGDTVTVTKSEEHASCFAHHVITVDSYRGTLPLVATPADATAMTATLAIEEAAVPDKNSFTLALDGVPSGHVTVGDTASLVNAVKGLFGTGCPAALEAQLGTATLFYDFEQFSPLAGERTAEESYCGMFSLKNPNHIFASNDEILAYTVSANSKFCMAYKGDVDSKVHVHFTYTDLQQLFQSMDLHLDVDLSADDWTHMCVDLHAIILSSASGTNIQITFLEMVLESSDSDFYVDNLFLGSVAKTDDELEVLHSQRRLPKTTKRVSDVTAAVTDNVYEVTMVPVNCAYDFPLIEIAYSELGVDGYTHTSWGTSSISVSRNGAASPPVGGTFDLTMAGDGTTYGGTLGTIAYDVESATLKNEIESLAGIEVVEVERTGSCRGYEWTVKFLSPGGRQGEMSAAGSFGNPEAEVETRIDVFGGIYLEPIPADWLRVAHIDPQVEIAINNVPSKCDGTCSFGWSDDATPEVTEVLSVEPVWTITGTGFSTDPTENTVTIGGVVCNVTAATETSITCNQGESPAGPQYLVVNVANKGNSNEFDVLISLYVNSISTTSGSKFGGTDITLTGLAMAQGIEVLIGVGECIVKSVEYTKTVCTTTFSPAGVVAVTASMGTEDAIFSTPLEFTFLDATATGVVSPTSFTVLGGDVTITGTGFGVTQFTGSAVLVGGEIAVVKSWSDTNIVVTAPPLGSGTHDFSLLLSPNGFAGLDVQAVTYVLEVGTVTPVDVSLLGKNVLTISGDGFTDGTEVTVNGVLCEGLTQTETSLTCKMGSCRGPHSVDNYGTSTVHGKGYAWQPANLEITVGEAVEWNWLSVIEAGTLQVFSTSDPSSVEYDENGFNSGEGTHSGKFVYRFDVPGTYYYGGCANTQCDIFMKGKVVVSDEVTSVTANVEVTTGEFKAAGTDALSVHCVASETPTVSEISPRIGHSNDLITIAGTGFSTVPGETKVFVGESECTIEGTLTATSVSCKVSTDTELSVGIKHEVTVEVNGGSSRSSIRKYDERFFVLTPHIAEISPRTGSLAGGTTLTITGGGLSGTSGISINGVKCTIESMSYTSVQCKTGSSEAVSMEVDVDVSANGLTLDPTCIATDCSFEYTAAATPTFSSIGPISVSGSTEMTITGAGFGTDAAQVVATIGGHACVPESSTDSEIKCLVDGLPVGDHETDVTILGKGLAVKDPGDFVISSSAEISTTSPSSGSTMGGTLLTISGNGFLEGNTQVSIDGSVCTIVSVSLSTIVCKTPYSSTAKTTTVEVTSGDTVYPEQTFVYDEASTPTITDISPTTGVPGNDITITGTKFTSGLVVTIGGVECEVTTSGATSATCTLGSRFGGAAAVSATVPTLGLASVDESVAFEYTFTVTDINPSSGSLGGGQLVTITGEGFADVSMVEICGTECPVETVSSSNSITCKTASTTTAGQCDVQVRNSETDTKSMPLAYTYDQSLTPTVDSVSPTSGGTGGGTLLTITGSGLQGASSITIDGSECDMISGHTNIEIQCTTTSHTGTVEAKVEVHFGTNGIAPTTNADFYYIDKWSSVFTWGGTTLPQDEEFVVIDAGKVILLDTETNKLSFLLIDGGKLLFENTETANVHLQSEKILLINGGVIEIGTADEPYVGQATITMHGHIRSAELPIYGTKTLGVRDGRLEMHGKPIDTTWALLDETVEIGGTEIVLQIPVTWQPGNEIVIATTGLRHSQKESEVRTIETITTENGKTRITLTEAVEYQHRGITETYTSANHGDVTYPYRAEVGLLTRNIKFKGSDDPAWHDPIEACPDGFNTGMHTAQTCFQGRFGDEVGSDQFGASIMMHSKTPTTDPDNPIASAHIEYVEFNYVGQAFRLGRYPIHWHLMGDVSGMYVRGCSIHKSFNRAVTIHGTHNLLVEHNVLYNIMGGAIFIEDGIETGNVIQYNLAVFVIQSTSLLNDDITPAAYWATNPNNTFQHNHAAGGTHFGFWYRMNQHPDGPSFDINICQQKHPLGGFRNNTVHSQGWFGIWIFTVYTPMLGGGCGSNTPAAAKFYSLTAWHCEKGAEWVIGGALQFHDFRLSSNEDSGIDLKSVSAWDTEESAAMVKNTVIIGHANFWDSSGYESGTGLFIPMATGLWLDGVTFININKNSHMAIGMTTISGTCVTLCGGFFVKTKRMEFINTPRRIRWRWEHEAVIKDQDGTLADRTTAVNIVPESDLYKDPNGDCVTSTEISLGAGSQFPSMICSASIKFHRWAFNKPSPSSLEYKDAVMVNDYGNSSSPYLKKRLTHKLGWMFLLRSNMSYMMSFKDVEHVTNISYSAAAYDFEDGDYLIIEHELYQKPDRIILSAADTSEVGNTTALTSTSSHLSWHYDIAESILSYMITGQSTESGTSQFSVSPEIYRCFYADCFTPISTGALDEINSIPEDANRITNVTTATECLTINFTTGDMTIPTDCKVLWSVENAVVTKFTIYGVLIFDKQLPSITLTATQIIVQGQLIAGFENDPYTAQLRILLRGHHKTPGVSVSSTLELGSKAIGCFGTCHFHGIPVQTSWTRLGVSALAGATQITPESSNAGWKVGDEIVITPSGYNAHRGEVRVISEVLNDGYAFTEPLEYDHFVNIKTFGDATEVDMSAEVGLLTRNIKIEGEEYDEMQEEAFGARVLVSTINSYNAKASFSAIEFIKSGQDGWWDGFDPRYSVAWVNAGLGSSIRDCSFHQGFAPAIGVFGTNSLPIERNVIHGTVHESIVLEGSLLTLEGNLISLNEFDGSFGDRFEEDNFNYPASVNVAKSLFLTMKNNVVSGGERVGYKIAGQPCDQTDVDVWSGNVVHSTLMGIMHMDETTGGCSLVKGFTIYKCWDYGYYHQTGDSVQFEDSILLDNTVSYLGFVVGPESKTHIYEDKYIQIKNCMFVGRSDENACTDDMDEQNDDNLILRRIAGANKKAKNPPTGGITGIMLPMFQSKHNGATFKGLDGNMKYPSLHGLLRVEDVTAVNFGETCSGRVDRLFFTNPKVEDAFHPTYVTNIKKFNVDDDSLVYFDRPSEGKINPADCVDMQCDAKLKVMIQDTDGSLLGQAGTILPQAEYGWDDDNKRNLGIGDYRIPKSLLTTIDGARIPVDEIAPNKGIVRNNACTWNTGWQAYKCAGSDAYNYKMVLIENLDADTETRRLSPVALLTNKYIDLNNGPQDHGWCSGYTCQKRISTFYTLMAMNEHTEVHFSGTPPASFRIHLLNSEATDKFTISFWIPNPQTIEVFDGETNRRLALNSYLENGKTKLYKPSASNPDEFTPTVNSLNGDHFLDFETRLLHIAVGGENAIVTLHQKPTITVNYGFPAISVDEFFEANIITNIAALLNIPEDKIRRVNVVRETTSSRKRRSGDTEQFEFQIETDTVDEAGTAYDTLVGEQHLGRSVVPGVTTISMSAKGPLTDAEIADTDAALAAGDVPAVSRTILIPTKMKLATTPVGEEKTQFTTPITIHLLDASDNIVTTASSWTVTATFTKTHADSDSSATMGGTVTLNFADGVATYTDVEISHSGTYVLTFASSSATISDITAEITVSERVVNGKVEMLTTDLPKEGTDLQFEVQLTDVNNMDLEDPGYKYTYKLDVGLDDPGMYSSAASVTGTTTFDFDGTTGKATTIGLSLNGVEKYKIYNLKFRLYTDPASSYDKTIDIQKVQIYPTDEADYIHVDAPIQISLELKTTSDYSTILGTSEKETMETSIYNNIDGYSSNVLVTPLAASSDSDSKLKLVGTANSKSQSDLDSFVQNLDSNGVLRFGDSEIRLATDCGVVIDNVCYGQTTTVSGSNVTDNHATGPVEASSVDDNQTAIIIFATLGACALLSVVIVVTTCIVKRQNTVRKVSAMRCMNNSQASTDSGRPLSNSVDSFQPGQNVEWVSPTLDYDEAYRMTPVAP